MFLRSLSLRGFKSFANKSILRFEPGITAIVGPNGSGKSNITDAALWVLGEQSARTLRGSTMQDVIFSGSTTRQSLGIAEVSLVLDNSDGLIPIEYSEVTVTRRCYRSGESEYYINNSPCRLIDIQELLSDSGMGRETYSIISQGKLDDVLNSKPEDRRKLIEEAAGVLKHKKRKERALRKLSSMEDNMTRARDILKEIGRQLIPLEKQANVTEIYTKLSDDLKKAEVALSVIELRRYQQEWEINETVSAEEDQKASGLKSELEARDEIISACEAELESKGIAAEDIGERRRRVESISQRINSGLLLLEEKGRNLVDRLSELRQKIYQLERRKTAGARELQRLESEKSASDQKLAALYANLAELRKQAEQVKKGGRRISEDYESLRRRLESDRNCLMAAESAQNKGLARAASAREQADFLKTQLETVSIRSGNLCQEKELIDADLSDLNKKRQPLANDIDTSRRRIDGLIEAVDKARLENEEAAAEQNKILAKAAALNDLSESLSPSTSAGSWLLTEEKKFPGLIGRVGDMVSVPAQYDKAIEAVLAQDVHSVVAKDFSAIVRTFESLDEREGEFVSLVPAASNYLKAADRPDPEWATSAIDVIESRPEIRPAVELLLDGVYIVDDLKTVFARQNILPAHCIFVTLKGEILTERGVVRRGLFKPDTLGLLGCQRELAELKEKEIGAEAGVAKTAGFFQRAKSDLDERQKQVLIQATEMQDLDARISVKEARRQHLEEQLTALASQESELKARIDDRISDASESEAEEGIQAAGIEEIKKRVEEIEAKLESVRSEREKQLELEKDTMLNLGRCQVEVASLTERQVHLKRQTINISADLKEAEEALNSSVQVEAAIESLRSRVEPVHLLYTELRLSAEGWVEILRERSEREFGETKETRERLKAAQEAARELSARLDSRRQAATDTQVKQAQLQERVNSTIERLVDELQIPIEKALDTVSAEAESEPYERQRRRLKSKLAELGPVNPLAVQEYHDLSERREFLNQQIEDMQKSRKALEKVVEAIDRKVEEKFAFTLEQVKVHFQRVFEDLFPGGRVSLTLTEADDISAAGIEIEAQPFGKALQSLSLLSGGEKSLVGLALLFAIYYTRPSPFYILDEVEAALDDVNLQRLIGLLNKLKTNTQILIITHQRRSMEVADSLYGVSMQADGVSKLISQRLGDKEKKGDYVRETELVGPAEIGSGQIPN